MTDAVNVPLGLLRIELSKLDRDRTYITYSDSGKRASTAAFLMMRERIAPLPRRGLQHVPSSTDSRADGATKATVGFQFELESETGAEPKPKPKSQSLALPR